MLVVKPHDRFDVHKTLSHRFLSNSSCLTDLSNLEARHGISITNWTLLSFLMLSLFAAPIFFKHIRIFSQFSEMWPSTYIRCNVLIWASFVRMMFIFPTVNFTFVFAAVLFLQLIFTGVSMGWNLPNLSALKIVTIWKSCPMFWRRFWTLKKYNFNSISLNVKSLAKSYCL